MDQKVFRCVHCGYDLTGLTDTCPECGWIIDPQMLYLSVLQQPARASPARLVLGLFSILAFLFVFCVAFGIAALIIVYAMLPEPAKP